MRMRRWIGRGAALAWLVATTASGQSAAEPRLKGATSEPPKEAVTGAPLDVARLLRVPPRDRNAAPLYLDALFEFGPDVAGAFPEGPERDRRKAQAAERARKFFEVFQAFHKDAKAVPGAAVDAVVSQYREGFRKLAEAQKRDRCVFETGLGFTATLPHVQEARQVARVAAMKARRELDAGQVDAAIADLKMTLCLARDLQPRGYMISQLAAVAMNSAALHDIAMPILAAPGLTAGQTERLLAVLADHEARSIDAYTESLGMEYLSVRVTLLDLIRHQDKLAKEMGLAPGESVVRSMFNVTSKLDEGKGQPQVNVAPGGPTFPEDADTLMTRVTPEELNRAVGRINAFYAELLALKGKPALERLAGLPDAGKFFEGDAVLDVVTREMQPATAAVVQALARGAATVRAAECLAAVRFWQLNHNGDFPPDLAVAFGGFKPVPADPYDGKPMRMVAVDGAPVVYSIGKDGKDDGGKVDSENDRKPGDLVYRLPAVGAGR